MHNTNAGEKNLFFGGIPLDPVTQDYIPVAFTDINIVELSANPIKSASIYGQSGELIIETPQCHISSMLVSTINGVAPGSFVPPQDFICSTIGLRTLSANAAINCSTLTCSTINGVAPGTAILPPDVSFSTVTINETGDILLKGTTNNVTPSISSLTKARLLLDYSFPNNSNIKISVAALPNVNTTFRASFKNILTVSQLDTASNVEANFAPILCGGVGIGDFLSEYNDPAGYKYGTIKPYLNAGVSGMVINAPAFVVTAPTQMTSLSLSTLSVSSIVDYNFTSAGAIQASAISSSTGAFLSANLSTFNFNASAGGVNLGGINLGMGGFLGGLVGELVSGALTTTIAGAALGTGIAGLILPYTYPPGTSYPPGANISSFQTVNGTTQLQFSTLGTSTNTYYRYTSSIAGSDPTLTPNPLTFVSSVISPGTVCIRSFSDPINPANPSTFRSTLQSFGQWVPVPGSGGGVLNPNIVASTITLGNSLLNSIVTPGGASIGGVQLGTTSGSVYGTVFQANTSIKSPVITVGTAFDTGISMSYSGTMSAKLLYVSTIACSNLANINSVLIGNSVGGIVATAVNSGTVSANTAIVGTTLNVTGAAVANISTLNTNVETASQIFTSSILVTGNYTQGGVGTFSVAGAGGTVSIPNGTLSLVPTAPGGLTLNTTGLINTQSLAVVGSANVASNVTIGNTLTVGKIALVSSINTGVCAITGGSIYTPQFNSSPNPQQTIAPFNIASGSYTVPGLQINNAVSLRVIAAQSYTDNTNIIIAEPMSGIWDVYTTWYYSTGTGKVLRCYIVPISVHNITLAVVTNNTTNLTFNMTNTGQSITSLCVSWYAAPWCDFS